MLGTVCACVMCVCVCVCVCVCPGECSSHFPQIYHGAPVRPHISTTQPAPVSSLSSAAAQAPSLSWKVQLTEVQLEGWSWSRKHRSTIAAEKPTSPALCPPSGSALRDGVSCGIQPRSASAQRATRGPSSREVLPCHAMPREGGRGEVMHTR